MNLLTFKLPCMDKDTRRHLRAHNRHVTQSTTSSQTKPKNTAKDRQKAFREKRLADPETFQKFVSQP